MCTTEHANYKAMEAMPKYIHKQHTTVTHVVQSEVYVQSLSARPTS